MTPDKHKNHRGGRKQDGQQHQGNQPRRPGPDQQGDNRNAGQQQRNQPGETRQGGTLNPGQHQQQNPNVND
jgi:hypothetical protein